MRPGISRSQWFEFNRPSVGRLAFMVHRLTGIALAAYLFLHLAVLAQLQAGPSGWDGFVALAESPLFTLLDVILLAGVLFHGLNGLRMTLLGFGKALRWQGQLFWTALVVAIGFTAWGAVAMLQR